MKKLRLLSIVGITSIALAHAGWAGPHGGGGGGGFHGGGGGVHFGGGGGFSAPRTSFGGAINRGGGVGFGNPRFSGGIPHVATQPSRVQSFVPSRSPVVQSSSARSTRNLTNAGRGDRTANGQGRTATAVNRPDNRGGSPNGRQGQASRSTTPRP